MTGLRRVALAALVLLPLCAVGHEMSIAEMELRETAPGDFHWRWTTTGSPAPRAVLTPHWPQGCDAAEDLVRCGADGLSGTLEIEGVGDRYSAVLVRVRWLDGGSRVLTLTGAQPEARLYGSAEDKRGMGEIASAYTLLGIDHIFGGIDHLAFVLALLFLVGFRWPLLYTITAFTLAHSVTLALGALGWLTLRAPPVEATIALSIALVASEALGKERTAARRWPALVAFIFGLVHGLGFAGALQDFGLPQNHLAVALLTFNVGVEIGQLLTVLVAYLVYRALQGMPVFERARRPALYAIGGMAAYWSIARIASIVA